MQDNRTSRVVREPTAAEHRRATEHALAQIDRALREEPPGFPHLTRQGRWQWTADGSWTGGFWVGLLWLAYEMSGESRYRDAAVSWMRRLAGRARSDTPDLSFLFYPSFAAAYRLTGDSAFRQTALEAADHLLTLHHPRAQLLFTLYPERAALFGRAVGGSLIDFVMNLSLLWWAFAETQDEKYYRVAREHALRAAQWLVREDGSTFHVADFDLDSGALLGRGTIHGHSDGSCWARGQAWGVHGYALAYASTGERVFLDTLLRLTDFFVSCLPADDIPFWDLSDPGIPNVPRDSSAAAIFSAGWLGLRSKVQGPLEFQGWVETARGILAALIRHSTQADGADGIIGGACAYYKKGIGIGEATVWGDFYFMEALNRCRLS